MKQSDGQRVIEETKNEDRVNAVRGKQHEHHNIRRHVSKLVINGDNEKPIESIKCKKEMLCHEDVLAT